MADRSIDERGAKREEPVREESPFEKPSEAAPTSGAGGSGHRHPPISSLAREWRNPPDDFEDLVARTRSALDAFMEGLDASADGIGGVDLRAHRLIALSLIDLLKTVVSTRRKPSRTGTGSGIAKALEAIDREDNRKECIATVNELRGMLSTPMLSESSFFTLAPIAERLTENLPDGDTHGRIESVIAEGQREFQRGLWEWVSGNPEGLKRIASVLAAIDEAAPGKHPLWRIAARFSTLMAEEGAPPGHALTRLVGQIDHQIRRACAKGYKAERAPKALLHNMLFHIENAGSESERARRARKDFGLGQVFEIPEAGAGWPAAAHRKTMNLILGVLAELEGSSLSGAEITDIRRDLIRARDAMFLAAEPAIAWRTNRAVDCLGDPQKADLPAAAEIVSGVLEALRRQSPEAVDRKAERRDGDEPEASAPDLSRTLGFSRAKELMDRIDAAFAAEPDPDESDPLGAVSSPAAAADRQRESAPSDQATDDTRKPWAAATTSASAGEDESLAKSEAISPANSSSSSAMGSPFSIPAESPTSERRFANDIDEKEPPSRASAADEAEQKDHPAAAERVEEEETSLADAGFASRYEPPSKIDTTGPALEMLLERIHAHGDTQREIAGGVRRLGQGIEQLEALLGVDSPPEEERGSGKAGFDERREPSPKAGGEADGLAKGRRLIPVLEAIAAHTERLLERSQRESADIEKNLTVLRSLPLEIGIRRIRAIATRPRADGKTLSIEARGEDQRCDPAVMEQLFPIIEDLIERVIDKVIEAPSLGLRGGDSRPATLDLDFKLGRGSLALSIVTEGRALEEGPLAKIREAIDKARGCLEIFPSHRDRFVGLRIELPLTRWNEAVVVGSIKGKRFALFARDTVAILPHRRRERRGESRALGEERDLKILDASGSEGFEYEGDIYPLRDLSPPADPGDPPAARGGEASKASPRSLVLLSVDGKRAALLCDEIESADECTLCALPPLVGEFGSSAVIFADRRAPAVLLDSMSVIEGDDAATASSEEPPRG